jgi:hypothetical protein
MRKEVFTTIFNNNSWGSSESFSGMGLEIKNTVSLRKNISYLIKSLKIKSILDVPCGDMNWMQMLELKELKYEGWDIVDEIINLNKKSFSDRPNFSFFCKDALTDEIPNVDLIICRDLIIHFPFEATWNLLRNIVKSSSKYVLISHCRTDFPNTNIKFGEFYPVNLENPPFNFHKAMFYIKEEEEVKYMALYEIKTIRSHVKNHFKSLSTS